MLRLAKFCQLISLYSLIGYWTLSFNGFDYSYWYWDEISCSFCGIQMLKGISAYWSASFPWSGLFLEIIDYLFLVFIIVGICLFSLRSMLDNCSISSLRRICMTSLYSSKSSSGQFFIYSSLVWTYPFVFERIAPAIF